MHAVTCDRMTPERAGATRTVVYTTLYDLIAAVDEAIEPGEEDCVVPVVTHLLRAGRAQFLNYVDTETLWAEPDTACLAEESRCVPA